jgi:hypothetical protein
MSDSASRVFDQFRINFGEGLTPSEQFLRHLGERSFLRFWSHANPHAVRSKEICDLLVICGDYVIVFSDKSIDFQFHKNEQIAWRRWYREAITKSVQQVNGAVRHVVELRSPIFKDKFSTVPIGIPLPPPERAQVFRVAVVSVSNVPHDAESFRPILELDGAVTGAQHFEDDAIPFRVGDVSPGTDFVHVMDSVGLWAVLTTVDTVTDFARYLDARKAFIRGQSGNSAANEWCVLTRFLLSFTDEGEPLPLDNANPGRTHLGNDEWHSMSTKAALSARKAANEDSYLWDYLVDHQAQMVERQSFDFSNPSGVVDTERVVRHLALETRLNRWLLGRMWKEACLIAAPGQSANIRTMPHGDNDATTYVFVTLVTLDEFTDDEYREKRRTLLRNVTLATLFEYPTSEVIIGIASELGQLPDTYDLVYVNVVDEENQDSLWAEAKACWDFKNQNFGVTGRREIDE